MGNSLRLRLTIIFIGLATIPLLVVSLVLAQRNFTVISEQAVELQSEIAQRVTKDVEDLVGNRENELLFLTNIRNIMLLDEEEQLNALTGLLASQNMYREVALLDGAGQEKIRIAPLKTFAEDELENRAGLSEYEEPKASGTVYYSPVQFDEGTGEPFIVISVPSYDLRSGELLGVLVANFRFKPIWDAMSGAQVPGSGIVYVVDAENRVVAHRDPGIVLGGTQFAIPEDGIQAGLSGEEAAIASTSSQFGAQEFFIVAELVANEALSLAFSTLYAIGFVLVISVIMAIVISIFAARQIVRPIENLASTAEAIAAGDFSQRVEVERKDEIGVLASAFNNMTNQLANLINSLELRVEERTRAIATSSDVGRRLSTILDRNELVEAVVSQVQKAFDYYHVHIYLMDEQEQNLVMAGGTGEAGEKMLERKHQINIGQGLVGRAASTNAPVLVADVESDAEWLPNPLLPHTKAETAVPIAIGERVLGVLDVQQDKEFGLSQNDVELLVSITNQVAIALQVAEYLESTQTQAKQEALSNEIGQKIRSAKSVEQALQIAVRELGRALDAPKTRVILKNGSAHMPTAD